MHRYTIILKKKEYPIGIQTRIQADTLWLAEDHLIKLRDGCSQLFGYPHSRHQKFIFATFTTNEKSSTFSWKSQEGLLENVRPVTAIEIWELSGKTRIDHGMMSNSLKTPEYIEYMRQNYPKIKVGLPKIMTGAQFKEYYPGQKIRLFNETQIHNGYQWTTELNICQNFDAGTSCGKGFYFIEECYRDHWLGYNEMNMYWWAYIIIPDDAIVSVEDGKFCTNMMIVPEFFRLQ